MLKRVYINNHKCLVNFEWKPGALSLLMGPNGSGKSTIFGVLDLLSAFLSGERRIDDLFLETDITRWAGESLQRYEVDVEAKHGTYAYALSVEVEMGKGRAHVVEEALHLDGKPLFEARAGKAHTYRHDLKKGEKYPFPERQSLVAYLDTWDEQRRMGWFRDYMRRLIVIRMNPFAMEAESDREAERPNIGMTNFSNWYRFLSQEQQGRLSGLFAALGEVMEGFQSLSLPKTGQRRRAVRALFKDKAGECEYGIDELSEGQRVLLALYTVLELSVAAGRTVCIDEPDNFVALREIQPWLSGLKDKCLEGEGQALLISHNPEVINYLASSWGFWVDRAPNTPARIRALGEKKGGIAVSELVARGWIND